LRRERGVSELTVAVYVSDVGKLLIDRGGSDLRDLTAAEVSNAVLAQVGAWAPASVRRFGCSMRSFLRYCYVTGLIERDLSGAALPVSGRRRSLLPQGITPIQAKALLGACDRRRAVGRRDYAVIVVCCGLGCVPPRSQRCDSTTWIGEPGNSRSAARATVWTSCRCPSMSAKRSPPICDVAGHVPRRCGRFSFGYGHQRSASAGAG
jgi:hypothetical protein